MSIEILDECGVSFRDPDHARRMRLDMKEVTRAIRRCDALFHDADFVSAVAIPVDNSGQARGHVIADVVRIVHHKLHVRLARLAKVNPDPALDAIFGDALDT